jgi:thioredoxin-dependent peroxiredoxin
MCSLRDSMSELTRRDIVVFGISTDPLSENQNFAQRQGLNFVLLSDPGRQTARAFGVLLPNGMARRATFVIDKQGIIRYVDLNVQTATHGKDLQRVLASLSAN